MKPFGILFLLSLPAIAALGLDLWLEYGETMDFSKPLEFSTVGWLWLKYAKEGHDLLRDTISPETWENFIKPLLTQKLVFVAFVPLLLAIPLFLVMKIFGFGSYKGRGWLLGRNTKRSAEASFAYDVDLGLHKPEKMKYKRR